MQISKIQIPIQNNKGNKSWVNIKIYDVAYAIIKKINLEN